MGNLLPSYKKAIIEEIVDNITANSSHYYAFVANPIEYLDLIPESTKKDYDNYFENNWLTIFGKRLSNNDIVPVIKKNIWQSNTIYDSYDNTSNTLYEKNNFYVITEPSIEGGMYHIYKCIDNANNSPSTINPSSIGTPTQPSTFKTIPDNYKWRYITSISSSIYDRYSTTKYIPLSVNNSIVSTAPEYAGVDVVKVSNGGSGYSCWVSGNVKAVVNSTIIQLDENAINNNDFYNKNGIYLYNSESQTSELKEIKKYFISNGIRFVELDSPINTENISVTTTYTISPKVVFECDSINKPKAYSIVNPYGNSIQSIVILESGSNISWANVYIQSNNTFGSGANLVAVVPPPGGHGYDPLSELNVSGLAISFNFSNTESNTIPTSNVVYNKIGLLKNPFSLSESNTKGNRYYGNTFNQVLIANTIGNVFVKGETISGETSKAKGVVVFSNTSQVFIVGDNYFIDGENVANSSNVIVSTISIQKRPDLYLKDSKPIYTQNINNVNRLDNQTESFKLIIQV